MFDAIVMYNNGQAGDGYISTTDAHHFEECVSKGLECRDSHGCTAVDYNPDTEECRVYKDITYVYQSEGYTCADLKCYTADTTSTTTIT